MIPASTLTRQPQPRASWQQDMAAAITNPDVLLEMLGLGGREERLAAGTLSTGPATGTGSADAALPMSTVQLAAKAFPFRVPLSYVQRMRPGDLNDPLLRQVLPVSEELLEHEGFVQDPLGERQVVRAPGLLHKYQGRALIITTSACAVHCRYCFRREFPYEDQRSDAGRWREALNAIAADSSIEEVLLSGGDPLSLSDQRLESLTSELARIPHIRRLRVHTRQPIVLPSRVDAGLIAWIQRLPWPTVFVLHANHANEINSEVHEACAQLKGAGVTLLNQSVLLKGVNDDVSALAELSRALFDAGVLPYYLHLLDRVRGVAHFEVNEAHARRLVGELASVLPGYLVPRLVREIAGAPAKVAISPHFPAQ